MIYTFGTTARHNHLAGSLFANVFEAIKNKSLVAFQEQCSLVFWGEKRNPSEVRLVDATAVDSNFLDIIYELDCVQPDFMLFKNNTFITNEKQTRFAGIPDLIIEIWSESNTPEEKFFKFKLYSNPLTEHWYITQDRNEVECWIGDTRLPNQSLLNILKTKNNIEFDLRYLAL